MIWCWDETGLFFLFFMLFWGHNKPWTPSGSACLWRSGSQAVKTSFVFRVFLFLWLGLDVFVYLCVCVLTRQSSYVAVGGLNSHWRCAKQLVKYATESELEYLPSGCSSCRFNRGGTYCIELVSCGTSSMIMMLHAFLRILLWTCSILSFKMMCCQAASSAKQDEVEEAFSDACSACLSTIHSWCELC